MDPGVSFGAARPWGHERTPALLTIEDVLDIARHAAERAWVHVAMAGPSSIAIVPDNVDPIEHPEIHEIRRAFDRWYGWERPAPSYPEPPRDFGEFDPNG